MLSIIYKGIKVCLVLYVFTLSSNSGFLLSAQTNRDTISYDDVLRNKELSSGQLYKVNKNYEYLYHRPKGYHFASNLPKDFAGFGQLLVKKKSLPWIGAIVGSTALLVVYDQQLIEGVQNFGNYLGIDRERKFKNAIGFNVGGTAVDVLDLPQNFNSTLYFIGEGWPSIALTGGIFTYGLIKSDNRALQTASQIIESYLAMGITVQFFKRISGRESPFVATQNGGQWKPFPKPSKYQAEVPKHDAFPSGHLATLMATVTILSENYPEKKYIKPLGYALMTLNGLAMMNNGVHWISDYPLAIGLGWAYGKIVSRRGHKIVTGNPSLNRVIAKTSLRPAFFGSQGIGLSLYCSW